MYKFTLLFLLFIIPLFAQSESRRIDRLEIADREVRQILGELSYLAKQNQLLIQQGIESRKELRFRQESISNTLTEATGALKMIQWLLTGGFPAIVFVQVTQAIMNNRRNNLIETTLQKETV